MIERPRSGTGISSEKSPIEEIKSYILGRVTDKPRVLAIVGNPFSNALGDTVNFAYHVKYLRAALGPIQTTIWTSDSAAWKSLCGSDVSCTPFLTEAEAVYSYDLVLFDWVAMGASAEELYSGSDAALLEFSRPGWFRYRLGDRKWKLLYLPKTLNNSRRLQRIYQYLGLNIPAVKDSQDFISSANASGPIYLNPYGSSASKCLDERCLKETINQMVRRFGPGRLICSSAPARLPPGEGAAFNSLAEIVSQAAQRGSVRQLAPMTVPEYITRIRTAALTIGSDTSTQHIANYYGVPSIACYPSAAGYRFYFWGCPGPRSLCLRTPDAGNDTRMKHFAALIVCLANGLLNNMPVGEPARVNCCEQFVDICQAVANGSLSTMDGARELDRSLAEIRSCIPKRWNPFVLPELRQFAREVCVRADSHSHGGRDDLTLERLNDIYALKVVRLLMLTNGSHNSTKAIVVSKSESEREIAIS